MPLFAYFVVAGSLLLGLLFVAEAQLGRPSAPMSMVTNFHGLPEPFKANSAVAVLTVREAPQPDMSQFAMAQAAEKPAVQAAVKPVAEKKVKKQRKVAARPKAGGDLFAHSVTPGRNYGVW